MTTDSTILRLRKANPVPQPAAVDEDDLFDRITALEPDSRLEQPQSRATRNRRRRGLVLVLAAFAVAVLASTAFAISNWLMGDVVEPPVTRAEYVQAQKQLTLPPGYSWPKMYIPANSVTGVGAGGGHAVLAAMNAWECYWVDAIRDGDTAIAYYIGFDRAAAGEGLPIYLRLLHATIADAIAWGCKSLSLGRTALEPKAALGAKPEPMSVWLRHRVPAMNWVLRGLLGAVTHEEAPERNPFKATADK